MKTNSVSRLVLAALLVATLAGCGGSRKPGPQDYVGSWNDLRATNPKLKGVSILSREGNLVFARRGVNVLGCRQGIFLCEESNPNYYTTVETPVDYNTVEGSITIRQPMASGITVIADSSALYEIKVEADGHRVRAQNPMFTKASS